MLVQRVSQERLLHELGKAEEVRNPPVPVAAWLVLDGCERDGVLLGWASDPRGADDGLRGLVLAVREFAPGFCSEYLGWVRAEHIRRR